VSTADAIETERTARMSAQADHSVCPPIDGVASASYTVEETSDAAAWDAYVSSHPDATGYHRWGWRGIFQRTFGHDSVYLSAKAGDGRIAGILPLVEFGSRLFGRFAVSLPFVHYGGVVADTEEAAEALASRALSLARARRWEHIELRHVERERFSQWPSRRHKVAMRLRLPTGQEALWPALDRKIRNQVRKAEKSGCSAERGGVELLDAFYDVFARNMRDLGTPVYARRFFEEVLRTFEDEARVYIVRVDAEPVAASITVGWRSRVEVPWASALRAHSDKSPNMLLYWTMLSQAVTDGAAEFDFGRSTPGEGTFHFKKQWGAEATHLCWEYVGLAGVPPDMSPKNPKFRAAVAVWKRLPLPLASTIGPLIVRNIP
jgi:serine/alanine adding enzyme